MAGSCHNTILCNKTINRNKPGYSIVSFCNDVTHSTFAINILNEDKTEQQQGEPKLISCKLYIHSVFTFSLFYIYCYYNE